MDVSLTVFPVSAESKTFCHFYATKTGAQLCIYLCKLSLLDRFFLWRRKSFNLN